MRPLRWWAEAAPPGGDRVKESENLAATAVVNVAPVIIALTLVLAQLKFMVASL